MAYPNIDDYGLTADDLAAKYEGQGSHPEYLLSDWANEVVRYDTMTGYWEWVGSKLEQERDDLDRDNPYTQNIGVEL